MDKNTKCIIREEKNKQFCNNSVKAEIRVTLFHPDSERKSKQNWLLCEKHYKWFIEDDGKGWYRWYNNKVNVSPVIDYEVILDIEKLAYLSSENERKIHTLKEVI